MMKRRAVFLDRDGTLTHPYHYPSRVEHLKLYDQIGPALRSLQDMGFALVVITNQSGIARGYLSERDLEHLHDYLRSKLATSGVHLDGIYYCPHHPDGIVPELAIRCNCRKPEPGMLLRAASDLNLDLGSSWFVGDILSDVEAGKRAGCHTILVDLLQNPQPDRRNGKNVMQQSAPHTSYNSNRVTSTMSSNFAPGPEPRPDTFIRTPTFVAPGTIYALRIIQTVTRLEPELNLTYQPASWRISDNSEHSSVEELEVCSRSSIQPRQ